MIRLVLFHTPASPPFHHMAHLPRHLSEDQLLAYVEDALDAHQCERVETALAATPELLARMQAMREDRQRLAALPDPVLDIDLVDAAESQIVRPMLMEPPGAVRRRHRAAGRVRATRIAAAAMLALTAAGIGWAGYQGYAWWQHTGSTTQRVANAGQDANQDNVRRDDTAADATSPGAQVTAVPGDVVVHHPGRLVNPPQLAEGPTEGASRNAADSTSPAPTTDGPIRANLALAMNATSPTVARDAMAELASDLAGSPGAPVSLTENFSYAEAERLGMAMLADAARERAAEHSLPALAGSPFQRDAHGRDTLEAIEADESTGGSRHLIGVKDLSPDLEQQLVYSEFGATLTLTIRVDAIESLLVALSRRDDVRAALQVLIDDDDATDDTAGDGSTDADRWRAASRAAARIRRTLADLPPDALVHLPIIVRPATN